MGFLSLKLWASSHLPTHLSNPIIELTQAAPTGVYTLGQLSPGFKFWFLGPQSLLKGDLFAYLLRVGKLTVRYYLQEHYISKFWVVELNRGYRREFGQGVEWTWSPFLGSIP